MKLKIRDLAKKINMTQQRISANEKGKREPDLETLKMLANFFGITTDYLLGKDDTIKHTDNKICMLPVYGRIAAGQPNWAEECVEGRIPVDPDLMNIVNPEECFFLKVNGESMNKEIKNDSYALIRKTDIVENGDIAVVLVGGFDATLKKFSKQGDLIILEPMSTDPSFTTQVYDKKTEIKILGKYIGKMEMRD